MLPVRELPQWIFAGLSERIAHGLYPWQRLLVPFLTKQKCLKDLLETYSTVENMIARIKENLISSYFFSWEDRTNYLVEFNNLFGQKTSAEIKQDADEICNHNFDLLGSGKIHLCKNIDWHTDFASGRRWPLYPSKHVPIEYDDGSDIIRVWQLSRFQWGPTIGKAYWITNNHKYSKEFLNQV
ncbi:MAG: heparinase II/III family protein, partial [Patescibacteria group bacterium]|nr:heparinase II/III family protein [Patescibacteria group bacterium]